MQRIQQKIVKGLFCALAVSVLLGGCDSPTSPKNNPDSGQQGQQGQKGGSGAGGSGGGGGSSGGGTSSSGAVAGGGSYSSTKTPLTPEGKALPGTGPQEEQGDDPQTNPPPAKKKGTITVALFDGNEVTNDVTEGVYEKVTEEEAKKLAQAEPYVTEQEYDEGTAIPSADLAKLITEAAKNLNIELADAQGKYVFFKEKPTPAVSMALDLDKDLTDGMTIYMAKCKTAPKAKQEWTVTVDVATFAANDEVTLTGGVTYVKVTDAKALNLKKAYKTGQVYPKQLKKTIVKLLKEEAEKNGVALKNEQNGYVFFEAGSGNQKSQLTADSKIIDLDGADPALADNATIYMAKHK